MLLAAEPSVLRSRLPAPARGHNFPKRLGQILTQVRPDSISTRVIFVYLGLEGLGVWVFLCLFSLFCVGFVSILFALFLFSCWIVFGVGSSFVFVFFCFLLLFFVCFCFVCFLGGFTGQVRWPKGPPHLALSPPYFICFVFLFVFVCFFFFVLFLFFFLF